MPKVAPDFAAPYVNTSRFCALVFRALVYAAPNKGAKTVVFLVETRRRFDFFGLEVLTAAAFLLFG
jgi:hypothetical protein